MATTEANQNTLYIDAGNTRVKCAYFEDGWEVVSTVGYDGLAQLADSIKAFSASDLVISSVSDDFNLWCTQLDWPQVTMLTTADIPTQRLDYETPHSLGLDRWLSCAGAYGLSKQTVAVCTAGSALTIDVMDQHGVFRGGVILPGLDIIEKAAQLSAPRLPVAYLHNPTPIPARSTDDCIDAGARWMLIATLQQVLDQYEARYGLLRVWAGGGRAKDIAELLRGDHLPATVHSTSERLSRDVRIDEHLVFRGMRELYGIKLGATNAL